MSMRMVRGIACQVVGDGPPVLFITGLGGRADYWRQQVSALEPRFTCVTYDHAGIGASERCDPPFSVSSWADEALELIDELGFERIAVVGHSTGGAIAQWLAAHRPERVRVLCLSGTWAAADARFRAIFTLRRRILADFDGQAYAELGAILTMPLVWDEEAAISAKPPADPEVVLARIDALLAHDSTSWLDRIDAPTLVCGATDDLLVPPNHSRQLARLIPDARLAWFERGGHHFPQTRADAFNAQLVGFLTQEIGDRG